MGPGRISLGKQQGAHLLNSENRRGLWLQFREGPGETERPGLGHRSTAHVLLRVVSVVAFLWAHSGLSLLLSNGLLCKLYGLRDSQIPIETWRSLGVPKTNGFRTQSQRHQARKHASSSFLLSPYLRKRPIVMDPDSA